MLWSMALPMTITIPPPSFLSSFPPQFRDFPCRKCFPKSINRSRIKALFWEPKKAVDPPKTDRSLRNFTMTKINSEGDAVGPETTKLISVSVVSSIMEVSSSDWDACCLDATGPEEYNPFLTHGFLSSLEESGSAVKETGWIPRHVVAHDEDKNILGVVPLYLKSHSYGEYVFDHSWADAYYNYGARYYPKLQCCVPFTPVTGQRILIRNTSYKDQVFDILVSAMKDLAVKSQVSSLHITFPSVAEWERLKEKGFLQRTGMQYHWKNRNYKKLQLHVVGQQTELYTFSYFPELCCLKVTLPHEPCIILPPSQNDLPTFFAVTTNKLFDEFLMDMKQGKRKNIRQERKKISAQNLTMKRLRGYEIKAKHWDTFYTFYRNTTDNKWGNAYLTREFFHNMASKMGDSVLLVVAEEGDEVVAGALNLIGGEAIFGRLWGCLPHVYYPSLHFEACYYQAIEAAIELNLDKVEAGAQGEHKIQRGYLPVTTYSSHYILDEGFSAVIGNFLARETNQVEYVTKLIKESGPFKDGIL